MRKKAPRVDKPSKPSLLLSGPKKTVFSLIAAALIFASLEGAARLVLLVVAPPERNAARFVSGSVWAHERNPFHMADRELFWKLVPGHSSGQVVINQEGFRSKELTRAKPDGTLRIVVLGDSVTFGFNVAEKESYAYKLAQHLSDRSFQRPRWRSRNTEVMNAGVPGYSSWQGRKLYEIVVRGYEPDLVIAMFGYNDHHSALEGDREKYQRRNVEWFVNTFRNTGIYRMMNRFRGEPVDPLLREEPVPRVDLDAFKENVLDLQSMVQADSADCVFMTVPIRPDVPLVENFVGVDYELDGATRKAWLRQIDFAQRILGAPWSERLTNHFFHSVDVDDRTLTGEPNMCPRVLEASRRFPDLSIVQYLLASCYRAGGDEDKARRALLECRRLDTERLEMEAYNALLRQMARESLIDLVDMAALFEAQEEGGSLFLDVVHPSAKGHALIAESLSEHLFSGAELQ